MAQASEIKVTVNLSEIQEARRQVKRIIADAGEANRKLAALEERVVGLSGELASLGIRLEVSR